MDPYKVLGVNRGDDEETIKKAYRNLVKKYHPDRYVNTPMADMANEKLKEINEAYDMITNKKTDTNSYSAGYGNGYRGYYSNYSSSFESVRMLIRLRRFSDAERMLSGLEQNAEWYYLMGLIYINRGWYDKGREFVQRAVNMDPYNVEYSKTLESFNNQNENYRTYRKEYVDFCGTGTLLPCICGSVLCSRICCCC